MQVSENLRSYWRKNLRITAVLMCVWFAVTFGVAYFARDLSFNFFGWPFSFWVAAQGAMLLPQQAVTRELGARGSRPATRPAPDRGLRERALLFLRGRLGLVGLGQLDRPRGT